jgi:deoxyadenosine/deoxycytidine kinase
MARLILIEGIPGSGKTTLAAKTADYLASKKKTLFYEEGASHPADLAWCACIPKVRFNEVINQFPDYEKKIVEHMYQEGDYFVVPYTRFTIEDAEFYQCMESFEVYDNRVSPEVFVDLHLKKWITFGKEKESVDEYIVFECSFLQNHINELLMFHNSAREDITVYLNRLIDTVKALNPILIYLKQSNVHETIRRVSEVRVNEQGEQVWKDRVISYIENTPFGQTHGLKGFKGMVQYFEIRKMLELAILEELPVQTYILDNPDYNWEQLWVKLKEVLDKV